MQFISGHQVYGSLGYSSSVPSLASPSMAHTPAFVFGTGSLVGGSFVYCPRPVSSSRRFSPRRCSCWSFPFLLELSSACVCYFCTPCLCRTRLLTCRRFSAVQRRCSFCLSPASQPPLGRTPSPRFRVAVSSVSVQSVQSVQFSSLGFVAVHQWSSGLR